MLADWPSGAQTQVAKCHPSDIEVWLNRYEFGSVSRNLRLGCAKDVLRMVLEDGIIGRSLRL